MANYIPLQSTAVKPDKQFESIGGPGNVFLPDPTKYTGVSGTEQNVGQYIESGIGGKVYGQYKDASGNTFKLNPDSTGGYSQPTGSLEQLSGNPAQGSTTVSPSEFMKTHRDLLPGNTPDGQSYQGYNANTPTYDPTKGPQYDYGKGPTSTPLDPNSLAPNSTTPGAAPNTPAGNAFAQQNSAYLQNIAKTNPELANTLANSLNYSPQEKAQLGLAAAQAGGTPAPTSMGPGMAGAKALMPPSPDPKDEAMKQKTTLLLNQDAAHQKIIDDWKNFQSAQSTASNLIQTYDSIKNSLGITGIDAKMLNLTNVMNGTEDDIRNEVSKAGGFATNSQILALTSARNKVSIQQYNNLVETRKMAMDELNTKVGLAKDERDYAMKMIDQQLNFDQKAADFADKAVANAQSANKNIIDTIGWDGFYAAQGNDPHAISNTAQVMGITPEAFKQASDYAAKERAQKQQMANLDLQSKQLGIKNQQAQLNQIPLDNKLKQAQIANTQANTANTYQNIADNKQKAALNNASNVDIPAVISQIKNPNETRSELGGLTLNGLTQKAQTYMTNGGNIQGLGLSNSGSSGIQRTLIANYGGYLADQMGMTVPQVTAMYKANSKGASDIIQRVAKVDAVSGALVSQFPRLAQLADKVGNMGIQESDLTAGAAKIASKFGSTDAANYAELIQTVRGDYTAMQAALGGSRGGEFFARNAQDAIPMGLTSQQYRGLADTIKQSADVATQATSATAQKLLGLGGGGSTTVMTDSQGKQWTVPADKVDLFKQNGYK